MQVLDRQQKLCNVELRLVFCESDLTSQMETQIAAWAVIQG